MAHKHFQGRRVTIDQQACAMRRMFPDFSANLKKNVVTWIGNIQPTSASSLYKIKITYSLEKTPKTWVMSPEISDRPDGKIPHIYKDNSLCLYLPKAREWSRDMLIAETILPWICLWLYYYEIWHATGLWLGGGIHPQRRKKKAKHRRNV